MRRARFVSIALAATAVFVGCRGTGRPQLFNPGSAKYQQTQAQRFDPYPDTDVGPSVTGGRPEGFTAPPPESVRGRENQYNAGAYPFGS